MIDLMIGYDNLGVQPRAIGSEVSNSVTSMSSSDAPSTPTTVASGGKSLGDQNSQSGKTN